MEHTPGSVSEEVPIKIDEYNKREVTLRELKDIETGLVIYLEGTWAQECGMGLYGAKILTEEEQPLFNYEATHNKYWLGRDIQTLGKLLVRAGELISIEEEKV